MSPSVLVRTGFCCALFIMSAAAFGAEERQAVPLGDVATWITNDDYPVAALRVEASGTVALILDVGVDGMPTSCTITSSSNSAALDEASCSAMMRRARFVPQRDDRGKFVPSRFTRKIAWRLPEPMSGNFTWVSFDTDVVPIACRATIAEKPRRLKAEVCTGLVAALLREHQSLEKPVQMSIEDNDQMLDP